MGHVTKEGDLGRYNRCKRRREQQDNCDAKRTLSAIDNSQDDDRRAQIHNTSCPSENDREQPNYPTIDNESVDVSTNEIADPTVTESDITVGSEKEGEIISLQLDNQNLRDEVIKLKSHAQVLTMELFESNQDVLQFYTALPNWIAFKAVLYLVAPSLPTSPNSKLTTFQMMVMFLMKLRLNLFDEDIGYRFCVHRTTVSRNFHKVLDVMDVKLSHLIKWPDRETLRETLPTSFRRFFKNVL